MYLKYLILEREALIKKTNTRVTNMYSLVRDESFLICDKVPRFKDDEYIIN